MGFDPAEDDDVEILNGGFDADTDWIKNPPWSIAGGKATYTGTPAGPQSMHQPVGWNEGFRYRVTFTLANVIFGGGPFAGLLVTVGGVVSAVFNTNGVKTFEVVATSSGGNLNFGLRLEQLGDTLDLDDVELIKFQNYVSDELEIHTILPVFTTVVPAVQTDYYNRLNARKDNTDILVAYDVP